MQSFRTEIENPIVEKDIIDLEKKISLFYEGKIDEERFRSFMENIPIYAYIKDSSLNHTYQNQKVKEISARMTDGVSSAKDIFDKTYTLSDSLQNGNVVLIFIRGQWCPFCNRHLRKLQQQFKLLYKEGASVVVITPETSEFIKKTIEKTGAEFTILYDEDYKIAGHFGHCCRQSGVYTTGLRRSRIR